MERDLQDEDADLLSESDCDSDCYADGYEHTLAARDPLDLTEGSLQMCTCIICLKPLEARSASSGNVCGNCATCFLIHTLLWVKPAAPGCPSEEWTPGTAAAHHALDGRPVASLAAPVSSQTETAVAAERESGPWSSGLGSGGSSGEESDWDGGGPVATVRHRRRVGADCALMRLKRRRGARPPAAGGPGLLRGHADRPPPVLHSAGVQPAGGAAPDRSPPPPAGADQEVGAAGGTDTRLRSVINGEGAGGGAAGGADGAPADVGGRPLTALKTVIDDGRRAEPGRTEDDLEDVSADEGVGDERTSPEGRPQERDDSPPVGGVQSPVVSPGAHRPASLDDVSDEDALAGNGVEHDDVDAMAEDREVGENGAGDLAGAETEPCSPGGADGADGDGEGETLLPGGEQPSIQEDRASEERLSTPEDGPSAPDERPSTLEERPSTPPVERPSTPEERTSTPEERPSTPEERSSSPVERPSSPEERPSTPEETPSPSAGRTPESPSAEVAEADPLKSPITERTPKSPNAEEAVVSPPKSPSVEAPAADPLESPMAERTPESEVVDLPESQSADPADSTTTAAATGVSDAIGSVAEGDADADAELCEAESGPDRPTDSTHQKEAFSPNQRLVETGDDVSEITSTLHQDCVAGGVSSGATGGFISDMGSVDNLPAEEALIFNDRATSGEKLHPREDRESAPSDMSDTESSIVAESSTRPDGSDCSEAAEPRELLPGHERVSDSEEPSAGDGDAGQGGVASDSKAAMRQNILPGHEYISDSGEESPVVVESSEHSDTVSGSKAASEHSLLPGHERVSDSGDEVEPAVAASPNGAAVSDSAAVVGGAAGLASPVYSPVMSPASIHSLESVGSPQRGSAAAPAEAAAGHSALGVADASDVSSDEELVRDEAGQPAASESSADGSQRPAGDWKLLPVESISSPESFGPDQEEPDEPAPAPEPEQTSPTPTETPPPTAAEPTVGPAAAPATTPAPLLCLGTEQISDNEEDGFDDGMEEGEIPSERPPTPPPPAPAPVLLPPALPAPAAESVLQRQPGDSEHYDDADLPEGDFEEGEIPSDLPPEPPVASPKRAEESPPPGSGTPPPDAVVQVPLSPADEPPPDGDYEEGEIVEEQPPSADEPADDDADSPPPLTVPPPRGEPSDGEEPVRGPSRGNASPSARHAATAGPTTINDDDDAPDVDEEVRDFVVSEKTITGLDDDEEGDTVGWKKFRSTRGRNYRDGKPAGRTAARSKETGESRKETRRSPPADGGRKGKKRDIQRYDVRKVITERKMRAQENQERAGVVRRSRSSSSAGSRSPRRAAQRWRRSRTLSRSPGRRHREHRRRSRERRSPPRRGHSRHSPARHSPARHSPSRLAHPRHSHPRHSLSPTPPHKRTQSPVKKGKDKSRERKRKLSPSPGAAPKKLKKRKEKVKKKDDKKKRKKRLKSPVSKAVIVDGDNLVVSVNFSKESRDRLGTKSRLVRHEDREPSVELSPVRDKPARVRDLPTPSKDKRLPVRDRDRDLPRRDREERVKPPRAGRQERDLSPARQRRDARKENKDPKQSARSERNKDGSERRSLSPRPARGSKRARSVTPPRKRRSPSPRSRAAASPRAAPRVRAPSPRSPRARLPSPRGRAASARTRTPSPRSRDQLSPRPRAPSPRGKAASPRARSRSRSTSERPRKHPRRSRSGSRSSSWSRSSDSSESPAPSHRRSDSLSRRRQRRSPDLIDLDEVVEVSPRRDEPIVITDSDGETESTAPRPTQTRAAAPAARPAPAATAESAASAPRATARSPRGPKTPPEPAAAEPSVRFSLSAKLAAVRMINNPLQEEDDEGDSPPASTAAATTAAAAAPAAATTQPSAAAPRGPTTPPEPPPPDASEAKFGDQYDPFEPTHSPSGTPDSPPSPDAMDSPELAASPAAPEPPPPAAAEPSPPPPPLPPAEQRDRAAEKPPEPRHPAEAEKTTTAASSAGDQPICRPAAAVGGQPAQQCSEQRATRHLTATAQSALRLGCPGRHLELSGGAGRAGGHHCASAGGTERPARLGRCDRHGRLAVLPRLPQLARLARG
ncbi:serine/arginine repetitive matrix protein 2-like [Amphibalanus amphitrite]|uniref:serine/arginine repetitive matrix protein 2-like n=1 Tax=Amphibalanus amphitrite TaxID=1232801 RepID=UPI001C92089A|nr:serine/arginine repetitive matrix protein 2-like [Amphibalanus amphitrite]